MTPSLKTITVYTLRIAKSAVAQALVDLGTGARFYINKGQSLATAFAEVRGLVRNPPSCTNTAHLFFNQRR